MAALIRDEELAVLANADRQPGVLRYRSRDARRQMLAVADRYDALAQDAERFIERFGAPSGGWADDDPP